MVQPTEDIQYAGLRSISFAALLKETPSALEAFRSAIFEDGFLVLVDHGLSETDIERQFELSRAMFMPGAITEEEKQRLKMDVHAKGNFSGYKAKGVKEVAPGIWDNYEGFDLFQAEFDDTSLVPACIRPVVPEMRACVKHLRYHVQPKLYALLSRLLELPDEYLSERVSDQGIVGEGYLHHTLYHPKLPEELAKGSTTFAGHKDLSLVTYLFSQSVLGLQVMARDKTWRWVKHVPGGIVVNLGEVIEYLSGGHLLATQHRVVDPPRSQWGLPRYTLALFCHPKPDLPLEPLRESPLVQREGVKKVITADANVPVPTAGDFRIQRTQHAMTDETKEFLVIDGLTHRKERIGPYVVLEAF